MPRVRRTDVAKPSFAVLAHTEPALLACLCRRLAPYRVHVHVDAKVDVAPFRAALEDQQDRVRLVPDRVAVQWGGWKAVAATAGLIREALRDGEAGEHIALLSGQCYPLVPVSRFAEYLSNAPYRQHARAYSLATEGGWHADRYLKRWHFDLTWPGPKSAVRPVRALINEVDSRLRRPPSGLESVACGSQWMALTTECWSDLLLRADNCDPKPWRTTFAPDEMFFQTLLYGSPWARETYRGGVEPLPAVGLSGLANYHVLKPDFRGTFASIPHAAASGDEPPKFFLRKVDGQHSRALLKQLDEAASC